jgi:hypothetical protein
LRRGLRSFAASRLRADTDGSNASVNFLSHNTLKALTEKNRFIAALEALRRQRASFQQTPKTNQISGGLDQEVEE